MIDFDTDTDIGRNYDEDFIPEMKFMRFIVSAFSNTTKVKYDEAESQLSIAEEVMGVLET